jgi:hypothetical protein
MPTRLSLPFRIVVALATGLNLMTWSYAARADFWSWVTDLVTEPSDRVPEEASLGTVALPPDAIVTAPGEVRTIELGGDILELYPNTAVMVKTTPGKLTTVQVITGTVRARVAKRKSQTFRIQTPILVATVKGTLFEVSTNGAASAVSVYEGRVAVKAEHAVGGVDVTPGKTATVTAADRDPSLGKTPHGGAAAAAKALSHRATPPTASATDDQHGEDNKGNDRSREPNRSDRAPTGSGARPGGNGSGGTGSGGGDDSGEGGEGGGEGGEGGDGEGGEGGDDD